MKMIPTERARRDEEVGFGITSFGVTDKKLSSVFYQGPICNENIFKQGLNRKTERVIEKYAFGKQRRN